MLVETLEFLFNVIFIVQVDITCLASGSMKLLLVFREDTCQDPRSFGNTSGSHCDLGEQCRPTKKPRKQWLVVSTLDCCVTGLDKISPLVGRFGLSILVSTRLRGELKGDSFIKKDLRVRQNSEKSMYVIPFKCFFLLIIKFQLDVWSRQSLTEIASGKT